MKDTDFDNQNTSMPWIVSFKFDTVFFLLSWLLPWVLWGIVLFLPNGLPIAFLLFILIDNSHRAATLPLTLLDRGCPPKMKQFYFRGMVIIASIAIILSNFPSSLFTHIWYSLVLYWGSYHIVRQHYGFLRLYQARNKPINAQYARAEIIALYSGLAFPLLLNLSYGWVFQGRGSEFFRLPIPDGVAWIILSIFLIAMGFVFYGTVKERRSGIPLRVVHLLLAISNFWIGILWVGRTDVFLAILFITSYHDIQYHAMVWLVGKRRYQDPTVSAYPLIRPLFRNVGVFIAVILIGGIIQEIFKGGFSNLGILPAIFGHSAYFEKIMIAVFASYTYMHYLFDSRLWKFNEDKRLQKEFELIR